MAHPDLDTLLAAIVPAAGDMLLKQRSYHPFGAVIATDGTCSLVMHDIGKDNPPPLIVIEGIAQGFVKRGQAGEIRAAAICFDVKVENPTTGEKTDAICAQLEHTEGDAIDVYAPYEINDQGEPMFGELFASQGNAKLFVPLDGTAPDATPDA